MSGSDPKAYEIAIVGIVGLPPSYGGFETLAGRLVERWEGRRRVLVYCSGSDNAQRLDRYKGADLNYVKLRANGWQSIPYDMRCLLHAARNARSILLLGVSGAIALPLIRLLYPRVRIVTNIDGLEWRREKWGFFSRRFLKLSERIAVRQSHVVVADNRGIADHVQGEYGVAAECIAYGGDFATEGQLQQQGGYYLMLCRIEPENNVEAILEAFAATPERRLIAVGNWTHSEYSRDLYRRFGDVANCDLRAPVYDRDEVRRLRQAAAAYVHGHSAGGTNPALVEAMALGCCVFAFDVSYNRYTTEDNAVYWRDSDSLQALLRGQDREARADNGGRMVEIAERQYRWADIADAYERLLV